MLGPDYPFPRVLIQFNDKLNTPFLLYPLKPPKLHAPPHLSLSFCPRGPSEGHQTLPPPA